MADGYELAYYGEVLARYATIRSAMLGAIECGIATGIDTSIYLKEGAEIRPAALARTEDGDGQ